MYQYHYFGFINIAQFTTFALTTFSTCVNSEVVGRFLRDNCDVPSSAFVTTLYRVRRTHKSLYTSIDVKHLHPPIIMC